MEFLLIGVVVTAAVAFLLIRRQKAKVASRKKTYPSKGTAPVPGSVPGSVPEAPAPVTPATPTLERPPKIQ